MLKQSRPTRATRIVGFALVALLGLCGTYAAWATQAPRPPTTSGAKADGAEWAVHLEIADGASAMSGSSDMQLVAREGQPTEVRYGKDDDRRRVVVTVTGIGNGIADLKVQLYRRDKLEATPELHVKEGEPAQIKVGSDHGTTSAFDGFDLHVTVKPTPSSALIVPAAAAKHEDAHAFGGADVEAGYRAMKPPVYPPDAIKRRIQGTMYVKVKIGTDGKVLDAKLDHANPESAGVALGDSAVAAVKSWTFEPASSNGIKIEGESIVPIEYAIHEDNDADGAPPEPDTLDKIKVRADDKG